VGIPAGIFDMILRKSSLKVVGSQRHLCMQGELHVLIRVSAPPKGSGKIAELLKCWM
jgi:hypothetical protein